MRIAIVNGDDFVGDDCEQLPARLTALGHDVTEYVRQRDPNLADEGLTDHRYVSGSAGHPGSLPKPEDALPFIGDWAAELAQMWSATQPDIVHAYGWLGGLAAQLAARRQRLPTVQTFQGIAVMQQGRPGRSYPHIERARLEPLLARNATWVTGGSSTEVETLARLRGDRARVSSLSTGVDIQRYPPAGSTARRSEHYRVLCVEANPLSPSGFDRAIRVLPSMTDMELVLAETDTATDQYDGARTELQHLAAKLGVSNRVHFMGTVTPDELPTLLQSAHVVVCTPRDSPRAVTALRAMASEVAVVAVAIGALTDSVVHAVTGVLVPPNNPTELIGALKSFQGQRFRCESMGAAGRSRAVSRFAWDRIALDVLNIYERVKTGGKPAGEHCMSAQNL